MSRENEELVRRALEAWNAGDLDLVTEMAAEDCVFVPLRSQLDEPPYRGRDGFRRFAADATQEYEFVRIIPDEIRSVGDRVVVLGHFDAKGRASGMDLRFPAAWVFEFRDGKIASLKAYSDQSEGLDAAGSQEA